MTLFRICEHNKVTLRGGKETGACGACNRHVSRETFSIPNTEPFFNHGLGVVTHGTRDAEKKAKARGLTPIGGEKIRTRNEKSDTITPILKEGIKKMHNLGEI